MGLVAENAELRKKLRTPESTAVDESDAAAVFGLVEGLTNRGYRVTLAIELSAGNSLRFVGDPGPVPS